MAAVSSRAARAEFESRRGDEGPHGARRARFRVEDSPYGACGGPLGTSVGARHRGAVGGPCYRPRMADRRQFEDVYRAESQRVQRVLDLYSEEQRSFPREVWKDAQDQLGALKDH